MASYTLEQLTDLAINELPRWRQRLVEGRRRRRPDEFYARVAEQLSGVGCPCMYQAQLAFGAVNEEKELAQTSMEIDPDNLRMILDFIKEILPIILALFGL
jgi:hypothetical protein